MKKESDAPLVSDTARSSSPPDPSPSPDECIAQIREKLIPLAKARAREQYWITYIRDYCFSDDIELNHIEADRALRLFLLDFGCDELVKEYDKVKKPYL
jgi:hypothetical protein